jgi:hypothetical protein
VGFNLFVGPNMVKYVSPMYLRLFFWLNSHKSNFNILIYEFIFISMINKRNFLISLHNIQKTHVLNAFKYIFRDARISKYMSPSCKIGFQIYEKTVLG